MNVLGEMVPPRKIEEAGEYRDPKRYAWMLYPLWLLTPVISIVAALTTGEPAWYWLTPVFLYFVMPILDVFIGSDLTNPPESAVAKLEADPYYRWVLYMSVLMHYLVLLAGAWAVGTQSLSWVSYAGIALSAGIMNGFAVATAHELGHKKGSGERWLSKIVLATGAYGQYMIDHNRGHHRDVATPEDSGSARFGETFYRFALRQLPHSALLRPWQLEKERLARKGKGPWTLDNEFIQPVLITVIVYGTLITAFGAVAVPYLLIVAAVAYWFLCVADYIEHYGLLREKLPDGRYARVRPEHSWNTNHIASNIMFIHIQRHSDHHAWPTRRYQSLRSFDNLPTMPTGYPGMFGVALIPPLWRAVMYPRLLEMHGHDLNRINVDPAHRAALFRKYSKVSDRCEETSSGSSANTAALGRSMDSASAWKCPGCGYIYVEERGDESQGFVPGTRWHQIPAAWSCPDCSVRDKADFVPVTAPAAETAR